MAPRKSTKPNPIDPIALSIAALKSIKVAADFHRIGSTTESSVFQAAWNQLPESEQQRISEIVNSNTAPAPEAIAQELSACGTYLQLRGIKAEYGEVAVKQAWTLLLESERDRIKALCREPQPETAPELECNGACTQALSNEWSQEQAKLQPQPKPKKTLIELTDDLQQLDELLETIDGDNIPVELHQAVDTLLAQRNQTQDQLNEKLDNYAALIQNRTYWAATRKAEAERLARLAESDMKIVDFLKGKLKAYLEATDQKKLRTKYFNISVRTAGGKQALRLNVENPKDLPERFQRVTIEPDNIALREALLADDPEAKKVAFFAERTTYLAVN